MSPEALAYPFIFLAIFFEAFVLVTLLSKPAREVRRRAPSSATPTVAVIVPCRNEGETVAATADSLLALDYPADKLQVILVDNGSTDNTPEVMARYKDNPQVTVLSEAKPGKHNAVNAGIAATTAEFIGCLDADSFVDPAALRYIIARFDRPGVAAVTAAMSIHNPRNIVEHMQNAEYSFGISMRHAMAVINGLYVTPGPFSFYRKSVFEQLGGFRYGHQTEDMEMALRVQKAGFEIENAPLARVYTKAPRTIASLIKQRTRWTSGFLRNVLGEYRELMFAREHGVLGMLILPTSILAVGSGILLFFVSIVRGSFELVASIERHAGIPLSYVLTPRAPQIDWFYLPSNLLILLGIVTTLASLGLVLIGRTVSQTPMRLTRGMISYVLLYGLVAPIWLVRSTVDVLVGTERIWK